jgi:hypothetical protein
MSWLKNIFVDKTEQETMDTSTINTGESYLSTIDSTYVTGGYYGTMGSHPPTTGTYTVPGGLGGINTGIGVGTTTFPYTYTMPNNGVHIYGNGPYIATDKNKIDVDELAILMQTLRERLLIIIPNFEKHEKYEALKKAYDHYKLIESMLGEDNDNSSK